MKQAIHTIVYEWGYAAIFALSLAYFLLLYFGVGGLFLFVCKKLEKRGWLHKITPAEIPARQVRYEIKHSLVSVIIFALSALPLIYFIRAGSIVLLPDTVLNVLIGLAILTVWNEVHFFIIHRLLHLPFFMRRVHVIHHRSKIPTVYSVYSFHWLEAALLSTVSLTIAPFINFAPLALFIYPLVSLLFNFAGHCNYRFGTGTGHRWQLFATTHNQHHTAGKRNYGFASFIPDFIYHKLFDKK